ncbi:hypothetical protein [Xylanimonas protaetiae]|uniref:Limonene hydroxylase n=1 Tax=Xylanimonas protaetiae TaxID=2509457 RepID=A0A4P6FAQ9_9MICO|nr:hypothetical protein [Xylanimonas protaetiae]QAY71369.1 hypothetical protein ET471_16130 [Xylanimonas protaetiae]
MQAMLPRLSDGPSIYDVVRSHLTRTGELDDPLLDLPDDALVAPGAVRWAPGAVDGVMTHHTSGCDGVAAAQVPCTTRLVVDAAADPSERNLRALHVELSRVSPLGYVDDLLGAVAGAEPSPEGLHAVARWLVTTSPHRRAVKIGIALLGMVGFDADDADVVWTLALHEEFTLFASVALARNDDKPDEMLWQLARRLHGWGRIHCVERLATVDDDRIKDWLLRDGFRNTVMVEYLAWTAATAGDLVGVLRADPDREQLTAAGEILTALLSEGPTSDIGTYDDGEEAVGLFVEHLVADDGTLDDFAAVEAIYDFLQDDGAWATAARARWSPVRARIVEEFCTDILRRDHWPALVAEGLRSDDRRVFARADSAAAELGIDTFDVHVARIVRDPLGCSWFRAWAQADTMRAELLASLTRDLLPLDELTGGGLDARCASGAPAAHRALEWSLQALGEHPGVGGDLLLAGLCSPGTRHRGAAMESLSLWPRTAWPAAAREALADLAATDPDPGNRPRARRLLDDGCP